MANRSLSNHEALVHSVLTPDMHRWHLLTLAVILGTGYSLPGERRGR